MRNLTNRERKRALRAPAFWCIAEFKGIEPDHSTLEELGFGFVEGMRAQLCNWGVPDWVTQEESSD